MSDAPRIVSIDLTHLVRAALEAESRWAQTSLADESAATGEE